jgi:hypothetical protein
MQLVGSRILVLLYFLFKSLLKLVLQDKALHFIGYFQVLLNKQSPAQIFAHRLKQLVGDVLSA